MNAEVWEGGRDRLFRKKKTSVPFVQRVQKQRFFFLWLRAKGFVSPSEMWVRTTDERGNAYYYHLLTRETRWDSPSDDPPNAIYAIESAARVAITRTLLHAILWERIGRVFRTWSRVVRDWVTQGTVVPRIARALDAWMVKRDEVRCLTAHNKDLLEDLVIAKLSLQQLVRDLASERLDRAQNEFERLQAAARVRAQKS